MRRKRNSGSRGISILIIDDDANITASMKAYLERAGYIADVENDPIEAVERVRSGNYDILLLDYLMSPIHGDEFVRRVRNYYPAADLGIILVTGHKNLAPPIDALDSMDIQDYYEKDGRLENLLTRVASCSKAIMQSRTIRAYQKGTDIILGEIPGIYGCPMEKAAERILKSAIKLSAAEAGRVSFCAEGKEYEAVTEGFEGIAGIEERFQDHSGIVGGRIELDGYENGENERRLLRVFSRQAASALTNRCLFQRIEENLSDLEKAYLETVKSLRNTVEAKDRYTMGHSDRVSYLAALIAEEMKFPHDVVDKVSLAGTFHDIGKIGVTDVILQKAGKMTEAEFTEMKTHPEKGVSILSAIERFEEILPAVRHHHERVDGKGYPMGLSGDDIPIEARIIAVADCFDAMTSDRVYRSAMTMEDALSEIEASSGTQLDEEVVAAFLNIDKELLFTNLG